MSRTKVSISLSDDDIRRLDTLRGTIPRSDYVAHLIKKGKIPTEIKNDKLISEFSKCTSAIKAYIVAGDEDDVKRLDIYTKICDITDMMKKMAEY